MKWFYGALTFRQLTAAEDGFHQRVVSFVERSADSEAAISKVVADAKKSGGAAPEDEGWDHHDSAAYQLSEKTLAAIAADQNGGAK